MVRLHGPIPMLQFLYNSIYKAFGFFTRCKLNVITKNDMHQKVHVFIFLVYVQKGQFWK